MRVENGQFLSKGFVHMLLVTNAHCSCAVLASSELHLGKQVLCRAGFKVEPKPNESVPALQSGSCTWSPPSWAAPPTAHDKS